MSKSWEKEELLLVLHLYCQTAFGKLHQHNPEIINLAVVLGRTPSAVAMKACNFANLDPDLPRKGLKSTSKADRSLWEEFLENSNEIALAAEDLFEQKVMGPSGLSSVSVAENKTQLENTESLREVKTRRVQSFFRNSLLVSYENQCAISGLKLPSLLIASHIIPWKDSIERRADPTNGILLNGLYDKAFDRGYITFDEDWRVKLSNDLQVRSKDSDLCERLLNIEGRPLLMPKRFLPDPAAMKFHRNTVFEKAYL
jgi:putative restriction endonuclease